MFEFQLRSREDKAVAIWRLRLLAGVFALFAVFHGQSGWSQATCTWNQSRSGQWDNPTNWDGCSTGNGSPVGTPGPADHAVIGNIAPLAVVDVGASPRTVDRLSLSAGRIVGSADLTVLTRLNWTGGTIDGAPGTTLLLDSSSSSDIASGLHVLVARDLRILGTLTWTDGDLELQQDAEIDNQGQLVIDHSDLIRGGSLPLELRGDGSPLARLHNSSTPGASIEKLGNASVDFAANIGFDNGNAVLVSDGTLRIYSPGGDFGAYQVAPLARLEFGMPLGVTRDLTGTNAVAGGGVLHKFGEGTLSVNGGYALTGATEVVDGTLYIDSPTDPLSLPILRVSSPGVFSSPDNLVVSSALNWNGGEINGSSAGLSLTIPSGVTATVNLDDLRTTATLRSRDLINQGTFLISGTGTGPISARFTLDSASIDNQWDFELRANNDSNVVLDCAVQDCGSFFNRSAATLRLNDIHGIVVVGPSLTALNNDGLVDLVTGCGQISPPGVDTGTYRYNSSCTLAFFTRPDTERVFESGVVLNQVGSSYLQFEGSLRLNGATRAIGNSYIQPQATLFGPAAITFTGTTEWRGLIEGASLTETVTVAPGALLYTSNQPADSPLLFGRRLFNNGDLSISEVRLQLDGNAEIRNNSVLSLLGTPIAAGAIACASPPNCGLITNTASGTIQSSAAANGPLTQLEADIAVVNQGSLRVDNGVLALDSAYTAAPGSLLEVAAGAGLRRTAGNLALAAGILRGAGVINANLDTDNVDIEPAGAAVGNLGILGNFTATANTTYQMGIAGTVPPAAPRLGDRSSQPQGVPSYDRLTISGNATLNGTLDIFDLGYSATGSDVFDLMLYASRNGSVIAGLNPYSGVGLSLQTEATRLRLAGIGGGGCVWNPGGGGADNWTNPLKWTSCTGGVGPGPGPTGTPGASDIAIVGGASVVNLDVPVTVAELQFTGGTIGGPNNLSIANQLIWTGGSFQGPGSNVSLNAGATATLSGGQHTIDGRTFDLVGTANWSTGLIQLANGGALAIASSGVLNSNPSLAFESIFGSGSGTAEVRNAGAIVKLGPNYSGIGQSVQYSGTGAINVNAGDFTFAANSPAALAGSYIAAAGATLQFVGGDRSFDPSASLAGGNLVFGDSSPMPGINIVDACIGAGSTLIIRNAELALNCAGPTDLATLQIGEPLAVLQGSSAIRVNGSMGWGHGTIRGTGLTQTFEIAPGAVAQFDAPRGDQVPRTLDNRRFRNFGTINWIAANATEINNDARFANEIGGQLSFASAGPRNLTSNTPTTSLMTNAGTLSVAAGVQADIDVAFDNSGSVQLSTGQLRLHRAGTDVGSYSIAAPGVLHLDGAARSMGAGSVVSGSGAVGAVNGASVITSGTFEPHSLVIESGSVVQIDSASPQLIQTLSLQSATLTGSAEVRIGTHFNWRSGGIVASVGASPGPLVLQSGALLDMCGGLCVLSNRVLRIEGLADWRAGAVEVPMGAAGKILVAPGGILRTTPFKSAVRFRCAAPTCTTELEVAGRLEQLGDGADLALTAPLLVNGGTLVVASTNLSAPGVTVSSGAIELANGGNLVADPVILNGGVLRGNGVVTGAVSNVAGRVQPGASPGQINLVGTYAQGPAGFLDIEVAGLAPGINSDFLVVGGTAGLDGTLNVTNAGYALTAPATLQFLSSGDGLSGTFAVTNIAYPGYSVTYDSFTATLTPTAGGPLVVNSIGDPGDGMCDLGECTLREALVAANQLPDPNVIEFAIPALQCAGPGGACVIAPTAALPPITGPVLIDGYSQPGSFPNTQAPGLGLGSAAVLQIELDGAAASGADGLVINAPSLSLVEIHGMSLYHWNNAIHVQGPGDSSQLIGGNFIGLRVDGSLPTPVQATGIAVFGGHAVIGGGMAHDMNVIGGNSDGIRIGSIAPGSGVLVQGNLIGTSPNGLAARPNQLGIHAVTAAEIPGIVIGGNQADLRNVISGNAGDGIRFSCTAISVNCFDGASVLGNFIGPAVNAGPLGNGGDGIALSQMTSGLVAIGGVSPGAGNLIAFNAANGILATNFSGTARASFLVNEIFANGAQAIDLGADGRTANDAGDGDTGPNGLLNFPNFTSYSAPGGNSAVINLLLTTPDIGGNYPARVDFYKAVEDEPGVWLGSTSCAQFNVNCPASFAFPGGVTVNPEDVVLGIVTDGFGKSSEASFYATSSLVTSTTPDPSTVGTPYTVNVEVSSPQPFAPIGAVAVDDGTGNTCNVALSRVSDGLSSGSCQLPSQAPAGGRTVTAQYVFNNPLPAQPFTSSSSTVGHTIAGIPPVVSSISPTSGPTTGGTVVTLTGSDFEIGATTVNFGATAASLVNCASTTQCTATSPPGSGVVDVLATTAAGISANTAADDFTYACPATQVTNGNDSGAGSLRQIIADACAGSTITFSGAVAAVDLTSAELLIAKDLIIDGGLGVTVARQAAAPNFRIFTVSAGSTVVFDSLTVSNGNVGDDGGGIHNSGNLTVLDSVISGNASAAGNGGGGIANSGILFVDNTTIALNSASFAGGGLVQINGGSATLSRCALIGNSAQQGGAATSQSVSANASLTIDNCTISGNSASIAAPALLNISTGAGTTATLTLKNSTIANNTGPGSAITTGVNAGAANTTLQNNIYAGNSGTNVDTAAPGVTTSLGNNLSDDATGGGGPGDLINTDPLLATLANYGGPTQTHALLPGSPAINAANNAAAPPADQRGIARPQQGSADIGAFESRGFVLSLISGSPQTATVNTAFSAPLIAGIVANGVGEPVDGGKLVYTAPGAGASASLVTSPASVVAGQASVVATANSAPGSYSVGVSASGATGAANFALTNAGTYSVGGTVSGLVGSGLVLQNNGGDNLSIAANGAFTFATPLVDLSPYAVTVLTQPGAPTQNCSVANGSGTLAGANVSNVTVTCVAVNAVVNSVADPGTGTCDLAECTLREAITAANSTAGLDTISFDPVVFGVARTIILTAGELKPTQDLSIVGPGVALLNVSGNNSTRLFDGSGVNLSISGATLSGGNAVGSFNNGFGGAIHQVGGGLTLSDVVLSGNACSGTGAGGALVFLNNTSSLTRTTIAGNSCDSASAISMENANLTMVAGTISGNSATTGSALILRASAVDAALTLTNVTISGNSSVGENSAIQTQPFAGRTASVTLTNSTVSGNTTSNLAGNGAIWQRPSAGTHLIVLRNSIVAGNTVAGAAKDIEGTLDAGSAFNLIGSGGGLSDGVNGNQVGINLPLLAPLGNYGGTTSTQPLLPGSPAINAGSNALAPATDQRGIARPQLGTVDVGAFESQGFTLSLVSGTPQTTTVNTAFAQPLVVAVTAIAAGEPVNGGQVLYSAPGAGASATVTNPATIAAAQASVTATANGIVGSYNVTAAAAGASGSPTFALQNGTRATTTTIASIAPATSVVGQAYTVTVSVLDGVTPVTAGIVDVRQLSDGSTCSVNLASSSSCQLVARSALTTAVRANFLGAGSFAPSQSPNVAHQVDRASTAVIIVSDTPDPSQVLEPIQVVADVSVLAPGSGAPSGEVLITDGTASCSFNLPARSCALIPKALGAATIEARYFGDANFNGSSDTEAHTITVEGADLSIVKRNGLRLVPGGQPSSYILLVSNSGPQSVVNARVTDILPPQFSAASWTCSASGGASCPANGGGTVDALVSLPGGSSVSFVLTVTAQVSPEQIVSNRATVTPPANAPDPVTTNNESTDTDPIGIFGEGFETEDE